jgi:hypothetical protein
MDTDTREARHDARTLAEVLNAMHVRPEIMGMRTFVALTTDRWQVVWLPQSGWTAVPLSDQAKR